MLALAWQTFFAGEESFFEIKMFLNTQPFDGIYNVKGETDFAVRLGLV